MAKLNAIRIGRTINQGNFESLRIDVEIVADGRSSLNVNETLKDAHALIDYIAAGGGVDDLRVSEAVKILDSRKRLSKFLPK